MTDRIRIIPHSSKGIENMGSFEVRFPDGRPSQYFYWDNNRGRAAITLHMSQDQARRAAVIVARTEQASFDNGRPGCLLKTKAGSARIIRTSLLQDRTAADAAPDSVSKM